MPPADPAGIAHFIEGDGDSFAMYKAARVLVNGNAEDEPIARAAVKFESMLMGSLVASSGGSASGGD